MRGLGALVHRQRGVDSGIAVVHLLDPARMAVAPVALDVLERMVRRADARPAGPHRAVVALRKIHLVEEALAHLVHGDQVLVGAEPERDAGGAAEREGRMSGQHVGVGVARRQPRRDVEALGDPEVLLHARKIGADPHAGDDAAGVLAERPEQRPAARHERGLVERGIEHAAELRIGAVAAAADEDRHLRADVDGGAALVDVAVARRGSPAARRCPGRTAAYSSP